MSTRITVKDVMTTQVASVNGSTPFKDVAEVLIAYGVSAVPVVDAEGYVIGVVSEADLLRKEEFREQFYREGYKPPLRARLRHPDAARKASGDTAADLMTRPAVTVDAGEPVVRAARIMDERDVKRLIVVDGNGRLEGVVSRHDLLKVFVRSDAEILESAMWVENPRVHVRVDDGIVTLTGRMDRRSEAEIAARLIQRVNGVVDVVNKLDWDEDDEPGWGGR
ncbi:CBS domain-containing protein [Nonomuraea sp. NPDC050556]|uniref:CBS domain-containing protein n=1 Tax=Nonomuraea sp. NPDC050556 TaxID=3364369 RepID=UPI00378C78B4